jgi:hypothetical protein
MLGSFVHNAFHRLTQGIVNGTHMDVTALIKRLGSI